MELLGEVGRKEEEVVVGIHGGGSEGKPYLGGMLGKRTEVFDRER